MIKKYQLSSNLFSVKQKSIIFIDCVLPLKKEKIFSLQKPQLVYSLKSNDLNLSRNNSITNQSKEKLYIDREEISVFNLNNKFDKKSKVKLKRKNRDKVNSDAGYFFSQLKNKVSKLNINSVNSNKPKSLKLTKNSKKKDKVQNKVVQHTDYKSLKVNDNKEIILNNPLTIKELAYRLGITEAAIITWLFLQGISVTINEVVDVAIAKQVAKHYNITVSDKRKPYNLDNRIDLHRFSSPWINEKIKSSKRAPIITILGHVDHGKTTLLDYIRNTQLVQKEAGGITQHIVGYEVQWLYQSVKEKLVFVDTPGHAAFSAMRLRGAEVMDLAILVVAADDGLQPQTIEAIEYILERKIPYIVAINKIDKQDVNTNQIKEQLLKYNIVNQNWGETSNIIEVSALTGQNIDVLLFALCKLASLSNFSANYSCPAEGTILESNLSKTSGPLASVIVQNGILKIGDIIVSGNIYGRVKIMTNSSSKKVRTADPSSIVEVSGFSLIPQTGSKFYVVLNEKEAKKQTHLNPHSNNRFDYFRSLNTRITLDSYKQNLNLKRINIILKTDTQGSLEASINALSQIPQEKVQINIVAADIGFVANKDIVLAQDTNSLILGFNIEVTSNSRKLIENSNVTLQNFSIIYDLLDYVESYMINILEPEYNKNFIGKATVKTVFSINKGSVAGCFVDSGKLKVNLRIIVYDNAKIVYDGLITSLKRLKDDVNEVKAGNECGVMCQEYHQWTKFSRIEAYELVEKKKTLEKK